MADEKKVKPFENEGEEESNIIELTDEEGETSKFEYLTTIEKDGRLYVVLMLLDDDGCEPENDDDDGEVLVLEIKKDENGEDTYCSVEDENVSQAIFDQFIAMMETEDGDGE